MDRIPKFYTADEVADLLRITRRTVNNYVKAGQLKALHMGKFLRFTEDDIVDFLSRGLEEGYFERIAPPSMRKKESSPSETPAPVQGEPEETGNPEGVESVGGTAPAEETVEEIRADIRRSVLDYMERRRGQHEGK